MSDNPPTNERDVNKYSIPELYQMIKKYNVEPPRTTTKKKLVKCYVENVIPLLNKRVVQDSNKKKRNASEIEENITIKKTRVQNVEDDSDDDQDSDSYEDLDNNNMEDDNNNNNSNNISDENVNKFVSPKNFSFENTITPINANKNSGNKSSNNNSLNRNNSFGEERNTQKEIQKSQNNSNNNMAPKETIKIVNSNNSSYTSSQQTQNSQLSQQTQLSQPSTKSQTQQINTTRIQTTNEYQKQHQQQPQRYNDEIDSNSKINYSSSSSYSQGSSVLSQFNVEPTHRKGNLPTPPKGVNPNIIKTTNTKRVVYEESDSEVDENNRSRKSDSEAKILLYVFGPILLIFLFVFFFPEIKYNALLLSSSEPDYRAYLHSKNYIESKYGEWLCMESEDDGTRQTDGVFNIIEKTHKTSFNRNNVIQLMRKDPSLNFQNQEVSFNRQTGTELLPYVCRLKYYGFNYGVYLAVTFFTLFVVFSYIA